MEQIIPPKMCATLVCAVLARGGDPAFGEVGDVGWGEAGAPRGERKRLSAGLAPPPRRT